VEDKQSDALERVMDLVRYLRTHCPWDAAQTPRSLIPYLLEEAHESADAISDGDDEALRSELGDLLLNVAFQLVLGEEREAFDADAVAGTVIEKMQRRHPHLFGLGEREDWETLKARERDDDASLLHGVARGLDPLSRAHRIQDRVSAVGFDWEDATASSAHPKRGPLLRSRPPRPPSRRSWATSSSPWSISPASPAPTPSPRSTGPTPSSPAGSRRWRNAPRSGGWTWRLRRSTSSNRSGAR
jgi:NTP pyrophosphatase (non-canonical NTP hydrolase)